MNKKTKIFAFSLFLFTLFITVSAVLCPAQAENPAIVKLRDDCDKGNYKSAIAELTILIANSPQNDAAFSARGYCYANSADAANAFADAEKALSLNAKNVLALTVRGFYKATKKDLEGAIKDYDRALLLDPNHKLAAGMIERAYKQHPNPLTIASVSEKLASYKKEVEQSNQKYESYLKLSDFFRTVKQSEQGRSYFLSLAASTEKNVCAYYFAAKGYDYKSRKDYFDKAVFDFDGRNGATCSAEAAFWVGRNYNEIIGRNDQEALRFYKLALARDPKLPFVRTWIKNLDLPESSDASTENNDIADQQERINEVNRRHLQNIKDLEAKSAQYNKYNQERNRTLDTTPERRTQLLELMKKEMSAIIELSNKALAEFGSEFSQEQKNFYLQRIQTAKARLAAISQ